MNFISLGCNIYLELFYEIFIYSQLKLLLADKNFSEAILAEAVIEVQSFIPVRLKAHKYSFKNYYQLIYNNMRIICKFRKIQKNQEWIG